MKLSGQFQVCLFFFYLFIFLRKDFERTKSTKRKTNDFTLLEVFMCSKNCCLYCFLFAYFLFCWLMFACECSCTKSFRKKNKSDLKQP